MMHNHERVGRLFIWSWAFRQELKLESDIRQHMQEKHGTEFEGKFRTVHMTKGRGRRRGSIKSWYVHTKWSLKCSWTSKLIALEGTGHMVFIMWGEGVCHIRCLEEKVILVPNLFKCFLLTKGGDAFKKFSGCLWLNFLIFLTGCRSGPGGGSRIREFWDGLPRCGGHKDSSHRPALGT